MKIHATSDKKLTRYDAYEIAAAIIRAMELEVEFPHWDSAQNGYVVFDGNEQVAVVTL